MYTIEVEADTSEAEAAFLAFRAWEVWIKAGGLNIEEACSSEEN